MVTHVITQLNNNIIIIRSTYYSMDGDHTETCNLFRMMKDIFISVNEK